MAIGGAGYVIGQKMRPPADPFPQSGIEGMAQAY